MSNYNYDYDDAPKTKSKGRMDIWDMLSVLVLLITACVGVYFLLIYLYPDSAFNPYPPGALNATATPTITPIQLDSTWTPTLPPLMTETQTLLPTLTLEPSATLLSLITPSKTSTPTKTPKRPFAATLPQTADSTFYHPDSGCNWQGVAGTVVDKNNAPLPGYVVRLTGTYNGRTINIPTVSGTALSYGQSGFEIFLGTVPLLSKGNLFLQVEDLASLPLSEKISIDTFTECTKNLVLVQFKKNP